MPSPAPADPLAAIEQAMKLFPGGYFTIASKREVNNDFWYNVTVSDGAQDWTMWINATALYGQDLKKAKSASPITSTKTQTQTPISHSRPAPGAPAVHPPYEPGIVYITDKGKKFHTQSCQHLKSVKATLTRTEALSQGYEACEVCNP